MFYVLKKENERHDMVTVDEYVTREQAESHAVKNGPGYYRIEKRRVCVIEFWVREDRSIEYA